jgi:predicted DNA-binding transcriptional regulator YafY
VLRVRAARVLNMLLLLQRSGRLTARELGAALEVSERTILRDVEALSEAGVPIYTSRGSGGGIELMDGFQTRLTGLTGEEAECLFLVGQPQVAHRLGLGAPTRSARHKLSNAIRATLAEQADSLSNWFLHDPDPWTGHQIPHGELRRITRSIRERRRVELHLAEDQPVTVAPLGLLGRSLGPASLVTMCFRGDQGSQAPLDSSRHRRQRPLVPRLGHCLAGRRPLPDECARVKDWESPRREEAA